MSYVLTDADKRRNAAIVAGTFETAAEVTAQPSYGFCDYCRAWTYADLWRGSCGECRWRWSHYPATLPTALQRYRDAMPEVHSAESCEGTSCTAYGSLP